MARSHARLKVSIHRDADFLERTPEAKLTYLILLSDPRLSIAGVMELAERRWARTTGYDLATVTAALSELEEHGYVVVDGDTDEVLIRTLAKHDLDPNRVNVNLAKGWWGAWGVVESPVLRSKILHGMDENLWLRLQEHGPEDGKQTRRSARLEPQRHYPVTTDVSDLEEPRSQLPPSSLLSPVTSRQPESRPDDAEVRRALLAAAADIIGKRAAARPTTSNPEAVRKGVAAAVVRDRYQDAYAAIAANPTVTADELAEVLEPTHATSPNLRDGMARAQQLAAERSRRVMDGTACPSCDDVGLVLGDDGVAVECECRTKASA